MLLDERDVKRQMKRFLFWNVLFLVFLAQGVKAKPKVKLYIGSFFGVHINEAAAWSSAAVIPAVEMALEHVNKNSTILAQYSLDYIWRDSKASDRILLLYFL